VNVGKVLRKGDLGDLVLNDTGEDRQEDSVRITTALARLTANNARPLCFGGDHSVTFPIIRALAPKYPGLHILHFDAHPDMYDKLLGNELSHASPFARILEMGLVERLIQVGIRTMNGHQRKQNQKFGNVTVVSMQDWPPPSGTFDFPASAPVYVSVDLDALDPAFAPGVSHHEPGGLSTRELLGVLQTMRVPGGVVGADVVELNPDRDVDGVSAMVAGKIVKELAELMLRWPRGAPAKL